MSDPSRFIIVLVVPVDGRRAASTLGEEETNESRSEVFFVADLFRFRRSLSEENNRNRDLGARR